MKLVEKTWQHRRDFDGIYQCESCGFLTEIKSCYDDRNFHDNVTPGWTCGECGKSSKDLGIKNETQTRYPDGFQV